MIDIRRALFGFVIVTAAFVSVKYIALSLAPHSFWFNYDGVEFHPPAVEGKPLEMLSRSSWRRPVDVEWIDSLYCLRSGEERPMFITQTIFKKTKHFEPENASRWMFVNAPEAGKVCYVESNITVALDLGIKKTQVVRTDPFVIQSAAN